MSYPTAAVKYLTKHDVSLAKIGIRWRQFPESI
jgi:hypothetical protein